MNSKFQTVLAVVLVLGGQLTLNGQDFNNIQSKDSVIAGDGQLYEKMGAYNRQFNTKSKMAQKFLNQGVVWLHAFNHPEALRSFTSAAKLDPDCAWAWWGIAQSHGSYYNKTELTDEESRSCWYALQNALARIETAGEVERALIKAQAARFTNPWPIDRASLDAAYVQAMAKVWMQFPDDPDVGYLYAESMMITESWSLYSKSGDPKDVTLRIRKVLEQVMSLDSKHAGAKHLYIHAVEASSEPGKALRAARELDDLVPDAGHLVHMPSHIYVQTGHWQNAIEQNRKAVESDAKYRARNPQPAIKWGTQAHNAHMLAFAAMMTGQEKLAMKYANIIWEMIPEDQTDQIAHQLDGMLMTRYDVQKRFGRWDALIKEEEPAKCLPVTRAFWRAHRAIAFAAKKQFNHAKNEHRLFRVALDLVPKDQEKTGSTYVSILEISDHFIAGEIALQQQKWDEAIRHLRKAAELEYLLSYTEPPYWLQPVRHTLGAVYMKAGRFKEAEQAYREDLAKWKNNGWSLYGLSQALKEQGQYDDSKETLENFKKVWANADEPLSTTCKCLENIKSR